MAVQPPPPFEFPRFYDFPPMYTLQPNEATRHAQMEKWSSLIRDYCAHHRLFKLPLSSTSAATATASSSAPITGTTATDAASSAATAPDTNLFHNRRINRTLAPDAIKEVIAFMRKEGRAEYVTPGGDVLWVYWRTPDEWATLIEGWVEETAQKGSVLTLYELSEGEGTRGTEIHGLDADVLRQALQVLVKRGKAQVFGSEDSLGVKFF